MFKLTCYGESEFKKNKQVLIKYNYIVRKKLQNGFLLFSFRKQSNISDVWMDRSIPFPNKQKKNRINLQ